MSRRVRLRIAAGLVLFVAAGHTLGTFAPPPDDAAVKATLKAMETTLMPMPVGPPRSFATVMNGLSISDSVYLVVAGLFFWILAIRTAGSADKALLLLNSAGVLASAVIAAVCFFPVPAAALALGGLFGLWGMRAPA